MRRILTICCLLVLCKLNGQDIHFSMFHLNPMQLNPALCGAMREDIRAGGIYRKQWQSVPVPYLTFSGSYDQKITLPFIKSGFAGAGLLFNYDKAGDGQLSWLSMSANGSYTQILSANQFLTAGVQLGFAQRSIARDRLTFDDQFNGDVFDPGSPNGENLSKTSASLFDISAGIGYVLQVADSRSGLEAGVSLFHLNSPHYQFLGDSDSKLFSRLALYLTGNIQLAPVWDLVIRGAYQKQGPYGETLAGVGVTYHLSQKPGHQVALQAGSFYRFGDAIIPTFELHFNQWIAAFSYDVNTSGFQIATGHRGGPELALIYTFTKVKPLKAVKACPIF